MDAAHAKLLSIFVIFCATFSFFVAPIQLSRCLDTYGYTGERIMNILICLGGGVFLGTYLLHLEPGARMLLDHFWLGPKDIMYPITELLIGVGFFLILSFDRLIEIWYLRRERRAEMIPIRALNGTAAPNVNSTQTEPGDEEESGNTAEPPELITASRVQTVLTTIRSAIFPQAPGSCSHNTIHLHPVRDVILLSALSLHRLFEGISVGLQISSERVLGLTAAVLCHESVIGFSIGVRLIKQHWQQKNIATVAVVCCLIQAIGVSIGTGISEGLPPSTTLGITNGVLQALATGTFIYVTFFEILPGTLMGSEERCTNMIAVGVGFAFMAALATIYDHETMSMINM